MLPTLEYKGKFYIVENVPARVNEETGEQFFSLETVERLQKTIIGDSKPQKVVETPVFDLSKFPDTHACKSICHW